ncbi:peptidyl-prolyl cis-trans isomerase [Henriciella sp.]|uniref:peptidylprolyl isomerase n=1 Tax=Henriciella sp. TaxID=1968823 RepID=UPI00261AE86B|nr:peptidyl-prolyl cis-trans isomerase [Henriciella sp.]
MHRLVREPLVHFVLLAGLIFLGHAWLSERGRSAESTIVVSQADLERLAELYAVEAGSLPGERDMRGMLVDHVEQQALAREARKLGMAEGDTVIERRLAQKMRFMLSDLDEMEPPSDEVLESWLEEHEDRFAEPARWSFQHVFFTDAEAPKISDALDKLNNGADFDWRSLGEPFMLQREYSELPAREITRLFGSGFTQAVQALEAGDTWHGPVRSALGTHLVRVRKQTDAYRPPLEDIRPAVEADWRNQGQRERTAKEVQSIVDQYDVVIADGASE